MTETYQKSNEVMIGSDGATNRTIEKKKHCNFVSSHLLTLAISLLREESGTTKPVLCCQWSDVLLCTVSIPLVFILWNACVTPSSPAAYGHDLVSPLSNILTECNNLTFLSMTLQGLTMIEICIMILTFPFISLAILEPNSMYRN